MKKGFTLGEMVVTIGVVGFLAMVLLPVIKDVMPNQEQVMFKKAYYTTERAVAELVNDEELYPEAEDGQTDYLGNTVEIEYKGEKYGGESKFCELFASKLNRTSDIVCKTEGDKVAPTTFTNGADPVGNVTTTDTMVWLLPKKLNKTTQNSKCKQM